MSVQSLLTEIRELKDLIKVLQNIQNMASSLSSALSSASTNLKEVIVNGQAYDKGKLSEIVRDLGTLSSLCGSAIAKANKKITELQEEMAETFISVDVDQIKTKEGRDYYIGEFDRKY